MRHFYHIWAGGHYQDAVAEHAEALRAARLNVTPEIGIVGTPPQVAACAAYVSGQFTAWRLVIQAESGFEQVTLRVLRDAARRCPAGTPFLYAHTKGAMSRTARSVIWRREMTDICVRLWEDCTFALYSVEAAGCRWLGSRRIFAGNFWWARAGYLASLPDPSGDRHAAEEWLGTGDLTVADLMPGLPCTRQVRIRMLQQIAGGRAAGPWPGPGETTMVSELEAMELCRADGPHAPPVAEYAPG